MRVSKILEKKGSDDWLAFKKRLERVMIAVVKVFFDGLYADVEILLEGIFVDGGFFLCFQGLEDAVDESVLELDLLLDRFFEIIGERLCDGLAQRSDLFDFHRGLFLNNILIIEKKNWLSTGVFDF